MSLRPKANNFLLQKPLPPRERLFLRPKPPLAVPCTVRGGVIFEENDGGDLFQISECSKLCCVRIPSGPLGQLALHTQCAHWAPLSPRGAFPAPEVRVGADDSVRLQNAPILQKPSANPYAPSHLSVGVDAHIDPAECAGFTVISGEFVTAQRADRVVGPYNEIWQSPASADIVPVCGKHLLCTPASICGIII